MSERHDPMAYTADEHESQARCILPGDPRGLNPAGWIAAAQVHATLAVAARLETLNSLLAQMLEVMKGGK